MAKKFHTIRTFFIELLASHLKLSFAIVSLCIEDKDSVFCHCGPDFFQPERSEQHCCTPSGTHCHIDVWTNGVCRSRSLQCYNSYQDSHWYQPTLHHQPFHGTHEIMDGWTLTIIVFAQTNQTRYSILVSHAENI